MADYARLGGAGGAGDGMKSKEDASAAISAEWAKIKSDGEPANWLWSVINPSTGAYEIMASGAGGLEEMAAAGRPDAIQFGGCRVQLPGKVRFFHVLYVGPSVSAVKRGKALLQKTGAFNAMTGASGEIAVSDVANLAASVEKVAGVLV
jgi:hypothetical protein